MDDSLISFRSITKTFAGVTALDGVSLSIGRGECHALVGENGAGKSTLAKILAGIQRPDGGELSIDGQPAEFRSPRDAARAGVGMVHQELAFAPDLSVAENLAMGRYPRKWFALVDRRAMIRRAEELLGRIGVTLDVRAPLRTLSTAQEQLVQIAAAVGTGARILIFDEPTSSLAEPESQRLFALIEELRSRGVTTIYVSHRMPEVFRLCDRISVLRDGRLVGTLARAEATDDPGLLKKGDWLGAGSERAAKTGNGDVPVPLFQQTDRVVEMMIGRPLSEFFPQHLSRQPGAEVLRVTGLTSPGRFSNVSFTVRAGEIVGLAGLVGAGRSAVAQAIFGLDRQATGSASVHGKPLKLGSVRAAMKQGVALVPEDRKRQGVVLTMSCRANFSLAILDRLRRWGLLRQRLEARLAQEAFAALSVKTPSLDAPLAGLSGGNQQKIVLAKWLARQAKVLIVDEPTRGIDVGAKAAVHRLLDALARQGLAILLISSDLPELLALSSRVLVMREGRLVGELTRGELTQDRVLRLMSGVDEAA